MYQIRKTIFFRYILMIWLNFFLMKALAEPPSSDFNDAFSSRNISTIRDGKIKDDFFEYSHEHIAVQKWRKNDAAAKKICLMIYNKTLPYVSHISKDLDLSPKCNRALMKILTGLKQYKTWAFKMIDSSGKLSGGIMNSDPISLGNYDECLSVNAPDLFVGQYCNVDVNLPLPERQRFEPPKVAIPAFENFSSSVPADSVTGETLRKIQYLYNGEFKTALCVPSTCSKEEVQKVANKVVQLFEINADVVVRNCEVLNEKMEFSRREITIMIVLAIVLFLAITSTAVDVYLKLMSEDENYQENLSFLTKCILCFSFYTNTRRLFAPDTSVDTIKIFHGMKVLWNLWVIYYHVLVFTLFLLPSSAVKRLGLTKNFHSQVIAEVFTTVDIYFFISAVVHSYGIMKLKNTKINYGLHILRRILRLAIPFNFVMACVFLIPDLGSGPIWKEIIENFLAKKCRCNWWTNTVFITNLISSKYVCLGWFWYIAVDTQLYLLSLLVIIPMRSNPRFAFTMNILIFIGAICISQIFGFYYGLTQMPSHAYGHIEDIVYIFEKVYTRPYEHCSSCCIGLAVGYFLATRPRKSKIPLKISMALWLSSITFVTTLLHVVYEWNQWNTPNIILCMLYKSNKQFWWSAVLAWITVSCMTGNAGIVNKILSWPGFVALARLNYMVYLVHPIVIAVYLGSTRTLIETDKRSMLFMYIGTVVISYMCAYVCSLLFELPFMALQNAIFSSHIPDDVAKFKAHIVKKGKPEVTKNPLNDSVNEKEDYVAKKEVLPVSDCGSTRLRKLQ